MHARSETDGEAAGSVEIREPTQKTLIEWVCKLVREMAPKPGDIVPRGEIEKLTGLNWNDPRLMRNVLVAAKRELMLSTPAYEWSVKLDGLIFLSDGQAIKEMARRIREARGRYQTNALRSATIDRAKLNADELKTLDHHAKLSVHMYEQAKSAGRKRWIEKRKEPRRLE